ncbi:MAG TPA: PfkB family carbohydrate kinase [Pseudolabrys sp.]|nr:PfkB family carbohydrate kinase [Pseudolabrys sp.]
MRNEKNVPKILCAGIAVQDIVMRVQNFPEPGAKVTASEFIITGGGCAANAALAVARLNGRAAFAGPLGGANDAVSERILLDLAAEGVDCSGVERVDGGTASVSLILLDAEGEKTIATRRGVGLEQTLPADAGKLVSDVDAVLVDNRFPDFVTPVCRAAWTRKIPAVIDLDLATQPDDALLKLGTHVIASTEALRATTGLTEPAGALQRLIQHVPGFVAVTDGPKGVYWLDGTNLRHMPAFAVNAVDTLGAGDAFHAGFALALAEGLKLTEALRFASAAAALKCTRFGGAAGSPRRAEVDEFLERN